MASIFSLDRTPSEPHVRPIPQKYSGLVFEQPRCFHDIPIPPLEALRVCTSISPICGRAPRTRPGVKDTRQSDTRTASMTRMDIIWTKWKLAAKEDATE